jgi:hypothetical protein
MIDKLNNRNRYVLGLIFLTVLILRAPALFNDFYDVDELAAITQTRDYLAGYIPGADFVESKNFLYHTIFKGAYTISPDHGWVIVHFITMLIIFLTSVFIFFIGKKINGFKTGALAGLFYAALVSSFNRYFMATNGEVVYNLFLAAGLYFIVSYIYPLQVQGD